MIILIIDDSEVDFMLLEAFFRSLGHSAIHANSFADHHEVFELCDAVVVDVLMPDSSGAIVTQYFIDTCSKPVIAWSGQPSLGDEIPELKIVHKLDFEDDMTEWIGTIDG